MVIPGLKIDAEGSIPVYRQIADGIRAASLEGRLDAGKRLPPTRDLARQLGVNRHTVVAAYDELSAEGWVRSHTGKGTYLTPPGSQEHDEAIPAEEEDLWLTAFSRTVENPGVGGLLNMYQQANTTDGISFGGSYPARELMPLERFAEAMAETIANDGPNALVYGPTAGHTALREWIAGRMVQAGSSVDASRILITNGAQQAIDLVFHTFLDRGDNVLIEEPTYIGALSVLGSLGARVIGVPVDDQGLRPDLLAGALERYRPRLIYLQPGCHNPTTAVMGEARRREILALASRYRCLIVEDDWSSGLRFEGQEPPTLHAMDGGRRVIYLSTFSKKLLPGLRVGWLAASKPVLHRLVALKQIRDCGTSLLMQSALCRFLEGGGLERHLQTILPEYHARRDRMIQALERHMPQGVSWTRPPGGLFIWVTLPKNFDVQDLYLVARQKGVSYSKGEVFHSKSEASNTLRLTFSAVTPERIEEGVSILGKLIRKRWPDADGVSLPSAVEAMPIL